MLFYAAPLKGAYVITPELIKDERGFFTRVYCEDELKSHGLSPVGIQCNDSFNPKKGTLRGMHYQVEPYQEDKLVRCTKGSIYDVIVDLRKDSDTYCGWFCAMLTEYNHNSLYVPKGFAHGYLTLEDNTEVFYQVSQKYTKGAERGVRWDDPAFNIHWPIEPIVISERDWNHFPFEKE